MTRTELKAAIGNILTTNGANEISGADARQALDFIIDYVYNLEDDNVFDVIGMPSITSSDDGKAVIVDFDNSRFVLSADVYVTNGQVDSKISTALGLISLPNSSGITNVSGVLGETVTNALNTLNAEKATIAYVNEKTSGILTKQLSEVKRTPIENTNVFTVDSESEGKTPYLELPNAILLSFTTVEGLPTTGSTLVLDDLPAVDLLNQNGEEVGAMSEGVYWCIKDADESYRIQGVGISSSGGASSLADLSDVSSATPTDGNALMGNGTTFASRALVEADISDLDKYTQAEVDAALSSKMDGLLRPATSSNGQDYIVDSSAASKPVFTSYPESLLITIYNNNSAGGGTIDIDGLGVAALRDANTDTILNTNAFIVGRNYLLTKKDNVSPIYYVHGLSVESGTIPVLTEVPVGGIVFDGDKIYELTTEDELIIPIAESGHTPGLKHTYIKIEGNEVGNLIIIDEQIVLRGDVIDNEVTNFIVIKSFGSQIVEAYNVTSFEGYLPKNSESILFHFDPLKGVNSSSSPYTWIDVVNDYVLSSATFSDMIRIDGGWQGNGTDKAFRCTNTALMSAIRDGVAARSLQIHLVARKLTAQSGTGHMLLVFGGSAAEIRIQNSSLNKAFLALADDVPVSGITAAGDDDVINVKYLTSIDFRDVAGDIEADLYVNGVFDKTLDASALGTFDTLTDMTVCYRSASPAYYHGDIFDIIGATGDSDDFTANMNYLMNKHGIEA